MMKINTARVFFILYWVLFFNNVFAQILITPGGSAATIVQNTLVGTGVVVSNVSFTGNVSKQIGTFSGISNLGLSNGVVISSGDVALIPNNASAITSSEDLSAPGDPDLDIIANSNSNDAAILEFDFVPESDTITFRYVFGSEEYSDYVGQGFNDAFGFFISGPGIAGGFTNGAINLALLPGTSTPVSIDNVNNGFSNTGVVPSGPCTNCAYYNDNTNGNDIVFDGLTTVLTATVILSSCNTYHIKLAVSDAGADGAYDSGVFLEANSFNSTPLVTASGPTTFCPGDSVTLTANGNAITYQWSTGASTQSITVNTAGSYVVTITNGGGCTTSSSPITVTITNPLATITPSGPTTFCNGSSVTLSANPGTAYLWSNGATTQTINVTTAGTFSVTVYSGNCSVTSSSVSTVVNTPVATLTPQGPTIFCIGGNVVLAANAGSSFLWSNGITTQNLTVTQGGTYSVTVTDVNGCTASAPSVTITVNTAVASITASGPTLICPGDSVTLTSANANVYLWNTGATTQSISANLPGNYTVQITDGNGCTAISNTIAVTLGGNSAFITPQGQASYCKGDSLKLTANTGVSFLWSNGSSGQAIFVKTPGLFTVTVTDNNGCTSTSQPVNVNENPNPVSSFKTDTLQHCDSLHTVFTNLSMADSNATFSWNFGDGTSSVVENPVHYFFNPGSYPVVLTVTNPTGCKSRDTLKLTYESLITAVADFSFTPEVTNVFNPTVKFTDLSQGAISWFWDFGDKEVSDSVNPIHTYKDAGNYLVTLHVTDAEGCPVTITKQVLIIPTLFIPNSFTPNNDGKNEVFFDAGNMDGVESYDMMIWNRWGELVYRTANSLKPWDGKTQSGAKAQDGVYAYFVNIKVLTGKQFVFKGSLTVLR